MSINTTPKTAKDKSHPDNVNDAPIETQVLESLIAAKRVLSLIGTQKLKPLGIGPTQAALVRRLSFLKSASLAELSRATATDPAATTRAVENLIKREWIKQSENPADRRRWNLSLTPAGVRLAEKMQLIHEEVSRTLASTLNRKEQIQLVELLSKVTASLSESETQ